ncbi:MAG: TRAP transporter small permease subunit [Rhodospirillaceae bacterium]|nr:TRAP transporter small permease subunit [Rhodospirillaceae bacterium]MYG53443.1 TRAP transporter small permease subunit [Rhodospirillaceae bacterium]
MQERVRNWSNRVRKFLLVPAIVAVIALLFVNIVDRFVFDGALGISWVEELSVIVMIWLVFLSVFAIDQDGSHIRVQLLDLPGRLQEIIEDLAIILFVGFLVWSTWALLPRMFSKYAALGWPIEVGYYAILVGGSATILAKIGKYALRGLRRWN